MDFDVNKFHLNSLCKRHHRWGQTIKSLRRNINNSCLECEKIRYQEAIENDSEYHKKRYQSIRETSLKCNRKFHENNPNYKKNYNRKYYEANGEKIRLHNKEYYEANKNDILSKRKRKIREWYKINKDKIRMKRRTFYQNNLEQCRQSSAVLTRKRRSIKKGNHHAVYSKAEIFKLQELFNNKCAYCQKPNLKLTIDHFIAISKGGPDCLGNLIPACQSCNSSKHDSDPMIWYKSQEFYSPTQWKKILKVLGKTELNYTQIPLF
jgi:5-methylcytosine-specific restriction endonuclease McrA